MKRFYNMSEDERAAERLRRLPALIKAFRDLSEREIRGLVAAAMCCRDQRAEARKVLEQ